MLGVGAWLLAAGMLYAPVLARLFANWQADETYSHGFLIAPIALFLAWQQRDRLRNASPHPSTFGLAIIAGSLALYIIGSLGAELFLTRVSMIGVLAGTVLYAAGWKHLRLVVFPLFFLVFMIPLPTIVFDRSAIALQLVASRMGEHLLRAADVPVLRDGNILTLANVTLEVNDACSGIRSLTALLSVTALIAYFSDSAPWRRALIAFAAVPVAIGLNGVRIALTGLAASRFGPAVASGAIHAASGWLVFIVALGCVWALQRGLGSSDGRGAMHAHLGTA
jgi:exosortase